MAATQDDPREYQRIDKEQDEVRWNLFRQPDFEVMERTMKHKIIFDGRNQYDPRRLREKGWEYVGIGR